MLKTKKSFQFLLASAFLSFLDIGCGKSVDMGSVVMSSINNNSLFSCSAANLRQWTFTQPSPATSTDVDILFVIDTSSSMKEKLSKISTEIPLLLAQLNPAIDY